MDCERVSALVYDYLDGELSASERAAFEAHVEGCASCSAALEEARELLEKLKAAEYQPPEDLKANVMAAVAREKSARRTRFIRRTASAAAALLVFAGAAAAIPRITGGDTAESADHAVAEEAGKKSEAYGYDGSLPDPAAPNVEFYAGAADEAETGSYGDICAPEAPAVGSDYDVPDQKTEDAAFDSAASGSAEGIETDPGKAIMKYGAAYFAEHIGYYK